MYWSAVIVIFYWYVSEPVVFPLMREAYKHCIFMISLPFHYSAQFTVTNDIKFITDLDATYLHITELI